MDLPVKAVVLIVIAVLLLVSLGSFFIFRTGQSAGEVDARKTFGDMCLSFDSRGCPWNVTEDANFGNFINACKIIYGQDKEAFTCLYSFCDSCKKFDPAFSACAGRCTQLQGQSKVGIDIGAGCTLYKADCTGLKCGVC